MLQDSIWSHPGQYSSNDSYRDHNDIRECELTIRFIAYSKKLSGGEKTTFIV